MKNFVTFLIFLISVFFLSCSEHRKTEISIPDLMRYTNVFSKHIDPLNEKYEIEKLREIFFSDNDFEVRIWVSSFEDDGLLLRRADNEWSATAVKEINCKNYNYLPNKTYEVGKIKLSAPKSGWENAWQKLVEAGIFALPGSDEVSYIDGVGYIVETNQNGKYRVYFYSNPQHQKTDEAKQMMKIGEIVADEFGLNNFKIGSLCVEK
jgi:hypothetical protein